MHERPENSQSEFDSADKSDCMSDPPKLSILIPSWNSLEMLKLCLDSVVRHSQLPHQIVVHVNEGTDGTLDWIRRNKIDYTYTPQNVGICQALNLAAKICVAEYFVYLNDDMYVLPGWDRALCEAESVTGNQEPTYFSGTMVQRTRMAPSVVLADYGADPSSLDEAGLLRDFHAGKLARDDWNGATWPPCCVHRKWWKLVGGYSEELSPGFYSDIDFSMKLWQAGCRRFRGVGSSLAYHFGETTTSLVRGPRNQNVKRARIQFFRKWGILPSTFSRYYLRAGHPFQERTSEPDWRRSQWERLRLRLVSKLPSAKAG